MQLFVIMFSIKLREFLLIGACKKFSLEDQRKTKRRKKRKKAKVRRRMNQTPTRKKKRSLTRSIWKSVTPLIIRKDPARRTW